MAKPRTTTYSEVVAQRDLLAKSLITMLLGWMSNARQVEDYMLAEAILVKIYGEKWLEYFTKEEEA